MSDRSLPTGAPPRLRLVPSPDEARGADEFVARALTAMRRDPARRWTVATLSRAAGLSRAPFARRFRRATGTSPIRWLCAYRLGLARDRLIAGDATLGAIAVTIGYANEFALSKAFKRVYGIAPALFRRGLAGAERTTLGIARFRAAA